MLIELAGEQEPEERRTMQLRGRLGFAAWSSAAELIRKGKGPGGGGAGQRGAVSTRPFTPNSCLTVLSLALLDVSTLSP